MIDFFSTWGILIQEFVMKMTVGLYRDIWAEVQAMLYLKVMLTNRWHAEGKYKITKYEGTINEDG